MTEPQERPPHRTPGWVKAFWIALILLGILAIVALILRPGGHGPQRHFPGGAGLSHPAPGPHG